MLQLLFVIYFRKGLIYLKKFTFKSAISNLFMLACIMVFVGIFSSLFGSNNSLTWVCILIGIMLYWKMNIGIDKKEAPIIIVSLFVFTGIANRIAIINPFLGFFINLIAIFIIMYVPSLKPEYKAYMPFILCYIFDQSNVAIGKDFYTRMLSLLIGGLIVSAVYYYKHRNSEEKHIKFRELFTDFDISSPRFILSCKMAVGVSIAMLIGSLVGLQKTMWIAMSVMSLTQIDFDHTQKRFIYRIIATVVGSVMFVLLFQYLIPDKYVAFTTIILNYIYTFIEDYRYQMVFITVNSLSSSMVLFDPNTAIEIRIALVILGCVLGYCINRLNFRRLFVLIKRKLSLHKNKKSSETI